MSDSKKYMQVKHFYKQGFVQEINRRILHPCGLALEVDPVDEDLWVLRILDAREEPEGLYFDDADLSRARAQTVTDLFQSKVRHRREVFGHIIQPVPEKEEE